ncbi:MAG: hypothetical protein ACFFEK_01360 [Candidatus Thorarchaeota archaeon]
MTEEWVPCIFEFGSQTGAVLGTPHAAANVIQGEDIMLTYSIPLATRRGQQRLFLSGVTVGLTKADSGSRVTRMHVRGVNTDNRSTIWEDMRDYSGQNHIQNNFAEIDCSMYNVLKVVVYITTTEYSSLRISFVTAKCQYR